jgi:AraC-like DNA-binding protein
MDKEKELYTDFMAADNSDDVRAAVKRFYDGVLDNGRVEPSSLYDLTVRLLVGIEKRAVAESGTLGAYEKFQIMSVIRLGTLYEIQDYVSTFLTGLKEAVAPGQKESHCSIIKKTIKYMEQECSQASLQNVAQQVYMTPTYLSLLFKLNTGKTFIEHLTDIRIEKAKDMLKSTHFKNYEVAEKVGYQDSRYFSQIFKKKVGLSPSEYRESVGN